METGMLGGADSATVKEDLALDEAGLSDLVRRLIVLKGRGYPVANSYTFLRSFVGGKQPYRCHARKVFLELRPNGDLMDCLDRFRPVANVRETPLTEVLRRREIRRLRLKDVGCHFCNNANVIDTSNVWALRPESVCALIQRNVSG
jgi:MoaA/NifB/PqqE/SkfB family radical SAM enzyme